MDNGCTQIHHIFCHNMDTSACLLPSFQLIFILVCPIIKHYLRNKRKKTFPPSSTSSVVFSDK